MNAADHRVDAVLDAYKITAADQRAAVHDAYDVVSRHHAMYVISVAAEMIPDIRADIAADPDHTVVFLGRDGHSFAAAVRGLDPDLFSARCREVTVSRVAIEAAVQDREINAGIDFALPPVYREVRSAVNAEDITGAYQMLSRYLRGTGVPVGREGSAVTVVDNSLKGTVQELMAALYPQTTFKGRYASFAASPDDPHPGTKFGYAVHRPDNGLWAEELPEDPAMTFAARDPIATIEYTLNGPLTSPRRFIAQGPEQSPQRMEADQLAGINPGLIAAPYRDLTVREATKAVALLAVHDTAAHLGRTRRGQDLRPELRAEREKFTQQVRSWIRRTDDVDPKLGTFLDSFVRRADRDLVKQLGDKMSNQGVAPGQATELWRQFADARTMDVKRAFVKAIDTSYKPDAMASKTLPPAQPGEDRAPLRQPARLREPPGKSLERHRELG